MIKNLSAASVAGNANSDQVVTDGRNYRVLYGQVVLTTNGTVANRRVIIQALDTEDAIVFDSHSGAVVVASATNQHHELMQGIFRETSFVGNALQVPIPKDFILPQGWTLRVKIDAGVAGDSYDVTWVVDEVDKSAEAA